MTSQIAQPLSRKEIREIARDLRKALDLENEPYFPIMPFVEGILPRVDPKFELEVLSKDEMHDFHGLTFPDRHRILLREDVYERACDGKGRDRFTVAHEVGHYILHIPSKIVLAKLEQGMAVPNFMDPEWQADAFAGELLMPAHLMKGVSPVIIAEKCEVSEAAARYQSRKM